MASTHSNPQLELAFEYVRNTHKNIFLTGKAGTGKTTFLHQLSADLNKRMVVVAPTGVAAINARGMTIHSFFQLPFGPFVPGSTQDQSRQRRFTKEKIRLIKSLDLLVIDEISMVRADILDAIDEVLRRYKDRSKAFGGVQLLMIGDLHQLPPVVKDEEWMMLREHYQTAYFFGSLALKQTQPISIELKHIYRQSDATFIELLNKVRDNKIDQSVLDALNSRFIPNFQPKDEEAYITLTSHNASAQEINVEKLNLIPQPVRSFKAVIEGEFPAYSYPTEEVLEFKVGAQVMFVKNDLSRERRYYNGKIGQITRIEEATIWVKCPGEQDEISVGPVDWTNLKYVLDETSKEVKEEQLGSFRQYPLKLAWAITIHKSQGLTFERAIIDAQAAFAHGQVYVALSRCKSFEGIVLRSKIAPSSVKTDSVVRDYSEESDKNAPDATHLQRSKMDFQHALIRDLFDFYLLKRRFEQMLRVFMEHENSLSAEAFAQFRQIFLDTENSIISVAGKFSAQLPAYFSSGLLPEEHPDLQARLQKAAGYFTEKLEQVLPALRNLPVISDNKSVLKLALEALENLQKEAFIKKNGFVSIVPQFSAAAYLRARANAELDFQMAQQVKTPASKSKFSSDKPHAILAARLFAWRNEMAEVHNVDRYLVLPSRSIEELVKHMPADLKALKKIKGIGEAKLKQFGQEILLIIQAYCQEFEIDNTQMTIGLEEEPEPIKAPKPESRSISFELFQSGKSIAEIAAERGLVPGTIESHLNFYIGSGQLDILSLMSRERYLAIEQCFEELGAVPHGEIKAKLGDEYSYGEIRMVATHLKK